MIEVSNNRIYIAVNGSGNISDYLSITETNILSHLCYNGEVVFDTLLNCIYKNDHKRFRIFKVKDSFIELDSMSYLDHIEDGIFNEFESHYRRVDDRILESSMLNLSDLGYYIGSDK